MMGSVADRPCTSGRTKGVVPSTLKSNSDGASSVAEAVAPIVARKRLRFVFMRDLLREFPQPIHSSLFLTFQTRLKILHPFPLIVTLWITRSGTHRSTST